MHKKVMTFAAAILLAPAVYASPAVDGVAFIAPANGSAQQNLVVLGSQSSSGLKVNQVTSNGTLGGATLSTNSSTQIGDSASVIIGYDATHYCRLVFTYWSPTMNKDNALIMFNATGSSQCFGGWSINSWEFTGNSSKVYLNETA